MLERLHEFVQSLFNQHCKLWRVFFKRKYPLQCVWYCVYNIFHISEMLFACVVLYLWALASWLASQSASHQVVWQQIIENVNEIRWYYRIKRVLADFTCSIEIKSFDFIFVFYRNESREYFDDSECVCAVDGLMVYSLLFGWDDHLMSIESKIILVAMYHRFTSFFICPNYNMQSEKWHI